MELKGKVAIVTGGAGGLGRTFCATLARAGADVAVVDVNQEAIAAALTALQPEVQGRRFLGLVCDVRDPAQVQQTVSQVKAQLGGVDILVNNAGGSLYTPKALTEIQEAHWDMVLDVNLKGAFNFCQAAVPFMQAAGGGRIINLSSIGGRAPSIVTGVPYAAAKAGLIGLTRRLALEVGCHGINVNAVAPGTVLSGDRMVQLWNELTPEQQQKTLDTVPLGRLSTAQEQADVVLFLAGPASRYITGAVLDVNGGRFMG